MESTQRLRFPGIDYNCFTHPLDRQALKAVRQIPIIDTVFRKISEYLPEKAFRLSCLSDNIRLGPRQGARIYDMFREAAEILDMPKLPDLFLDAKYEINAFAFGMTDYTVTLYSGLVDMLTEDELMAIMGHELGHIKCEHMLYKYIGTILTQISGEIINATLGLGAIALVPLQLALFHWSRMAEYSCDRAALLVVQDPQVVAKALAKLAGASPRILPDLNMEEVLTQADEYKTMDDKVLWRVMKILQTMERSHPFPVVRAKEILQYSAGDEYRSILSGSYPRVGEKPAAGAVPCAKCGASIGSTFAFCPSCGAPAPAPPSCVACAKPLEAGWKMCPYCGTNQAQEVARCGKCSTVIQSGWVFCLKCGEKLVCDEAPAQPEPPPSA